MNLPPDVAVEQLGDLRQFTLSKEEAIRLEPDVRAVAVLRVHKTFESVPVNARLERSGLHVNLRSLSRSPLVLDREGIFQMPSHQALCRSLGVTLTNRCAIVGVTHELNAVPGPKATRSSESD